MGGSFIPRYKKRAVELEGLQTSSVWTIPRLRLERRGKPQLSTRLKTPLIFADAGGSFDLHDDITTEVTAIAGSDRFVISDESAAGDPNRYVTHRNLLDAIRDVLNVNNSTPDNTDRLYISDESGTGDPMEYITLAQLSAAIQDGTVDTVTMAVVGQILTLTIGRTVGLDLVATATLPAGGRWWRRWRRTSDGRGIGHLNILCHPD